MFGRTLVSVMIVMGSGLGPALAQEDLNRGKSPVQLFASDCADCHRNPRAVTKVRNADALAEFLRVHYTASRENAAAIADYLVSLAPDPRAGSARPAGPARPRPATAPDASKPSAASQPAEKPAEKPAETAAPAAPEAAPQAPAATAPAASAPAPADPQ